MALVLVDGCEDYSSWVATAGANVTTGRNNSCWLVTFGVTSDFTVPAALESNTVTLGFAFRFPTNMPGTSTQIVRLRSDAGATAHVDLVVFADGSMQVQRAGTNLGASSAGVIVVNTWAYIEAQVTLSDTVGAATVRVNGATVIGPLSGLDTKNAGTKTTFDTIRVTMSANVTGGGAVDDLYAMAGTGDSFQGDCAVETLYPNGDGHANAWVGSDGDSTSNYLLVNEVGAPVTASYTASATSTNQDIYTLTDLVRTQGTILGVCHSAIAGITDSGAKTLKLVSRRSSDTKTAGITLTTTFAPVHYVLTQDPETSAAWTITNVNALQAGVEVT